MKYILVLLSFLSVSFTYGQTHADISIMVVNPVDDQVFYDSDTIKYQYRIVNHGPNDFIAGVDTYYIGKTFSIAITANSETILAGDTSPVHTMGYFVNDSSTPKGEMNYCMYLLEHPNITDEVRSNDTFCGSFILESSLSINQHEMPESIKIYPIPFKDQLNIISNDELIQEIKIYDLLGRNMYKQTYQIGQSNLDLSLNTLGIGVYTIEIKTIHGRYFRIIQKE